MSIDPLTGFSDRFVISYFHQDDDDDHTDENNS